MRLLLALIVILLIASCTKDPDEPANIAANSQWISHWYHNDTMIGDCVDMQGNSTGEHDTMYAMKYGDTSCVLYNGIKYYVWASDFYDPVTGQINVVKVNDMVHENAYIGSVPFDTSQGILDHGYGTLIFPYKYQMEGDTTMYTRVQSILVNSMDKVKRVAGRQYMSHRLH